MKYRILLAGKASSIIDDFFLRLSDKFEIMTTSMRNDDILRHIKYFQPQLFLFCMYNESRDDFSKMIALKFQLEKFRVFIGIIGSQTDVTDFEHVAVNVSDFILVKPLTIDVIQKRIRDFLGERVPQNMSDPAVDSASSAKTASPVAPSPVTASPTAPSPATPGPAASSPAASSPVASSSAASSSAVPIYESALKTASDFMAQLDSLAPPQRRHVLVIDDDPRMLKMLKEQLHHDYEVATAVNGKIAMKFLESKHTDLILLDYEMPDEKGPQVLEKIRANQSTKDVPVIFLTGVTEKEKIQKALVLQPQGYLLKPIDRERLMETITKVLEG